MRVRRANLLRSHLESIRELGFSHVEWEWSWDGSGRTPLPDAAMLRNAPRLLPDLGLTLSVAGLNGFSLAEKVDPLRHISVGLWRDVYLAAGEIRAKWVVLELGSAGCDSDNHRLKRSRIEIACSAIGEAFESINTSVPLLVENQKRMPVGCKK